MQGLQCACVNSRVPWSQAMDVPACVFADADCCTHEQPALLTRIAPFSRRCWRTAAPSMAWWRSTGSCASLVTCRWVRGLLGVADVAARCRAAGCA